ncbi:CoA transferase [Alicyclobacillus tolerans]|uniref:CaiB/BaiF CoA transferase family protein n=1 Tax=Alicyclobacillus tolerans TaxID=90970 RepID=UPI001F466524|nr:CoA transferase [Alicyclobacillus tolerans]MCF8567953.1 CoA transferase [Alicyclobacillus tolerans]
MALSGVKILDFTQMMMGPWGTQFLGDMGADIIKVERPKVGEWERGLRAMGELLGGDSPFFLAMNRNKRSLTLDLKTEEAKEIVYRIVKSVDAVIENYRPGVMDRLGLGYEDLKKINPRLVYVSGSGYGNDGPYVKKPGQDLLIQSLTGLAAYGGRCDDPPTPAGTSIVDASTALMLALSTMVGLFHQKSSGEGQKIDVSLFNTAIAIQCQELAAFMNLDKRWQRSKAGIGGAWLSAPFGIYATADGYMAIAMASLSVIGELCDLPELAQYDTPDLAYSERDRVKVILEAKTRTQPTAYWLELLATRDIWCAKVNEFEDVVVDPQVQHNDLIQTIHHPTAGELKVIGIPVKMSETPGTIRLAPPAVGEHTDQVLSEYGYTDEEIQAFHENGIV